MCADKVSAGLSYDLNFKWHMSICAEICGAKQNYMPFLEPSPTAITGKKSKAQKHIQMAQRCALDFFSQNALGDGPAFWIFFPGFTDKG